MLHYHDHHITRSPPENHTRSEWTQSSAVVSDTFFNKIIDTHCVDQWRDSDCRLMILQPREHTGRTVYGWQKSPQLSGIRLYTFVYGFCVTPWRSLQQSEILSQRPALRPWVYHRLTFGDIHMPASGSFLLILYCNNRTGRCYVILYQTCVNAVFCCQLRTQLTSKPTSSLLIWSRVSKASLFAAINRQANGAWILNLAATLTLHTVLAVVQLVLHLLLRKWVH
jgi:hypothetical protein